MNDNTSSQDQARLKRHEEQEERSKVLWQGIGEHQRKEHLAFHLAKPHLVELEATIRQEREAIKHALNDRPAQAPDTSKPTLKNDAQESFGIKKTRTQGQSMGN